MQQSKNLSTSVMPFFMMLAIIIGFLITTALGNLNKGLVTNGHDGNIHPGGYSGGGYANSICCPGGLWPSPRGPCTALIPFCKCLEHEAGKENQICPYNGCGGKITKGEWCACINNDFQPCY